MSTIRLNRLLFAVGGVSLAVLNARFGDAAIVGNSLPSWLPQPTRWAYGLAGLMLMGSAALCMRRWSPTGLWVLSGCLVLWALLSVAPILATPLAFGAWYGLCEALTALAGAVVLQAQLHAAHTAPASRASLSGAMRAAECVFALTCIYYGWSHFLYADYTGGMVPAWLPAPLGIAYLTGGAHIAAGVAILINVRSHLAALLETLMMALFGLLVWIPSFFTDPRPAWATPPANQWSELTVNIMLVVSAWVVSTSLAPRAR